MTDVLSPGEQLAETVWPELLRLTPEERVVFLDTVLGEWCGSCGHCHPGNRSCQCENDE